MSGKTICFETSTEKIRMVRASVFVLQHVTKLTLCSFWLGEVV